MTHLRLLTRKPEVAQQGQVSPLESLILLLLPLFFGTWDNFPTVYQNLQKFYRKTPTG